MSLTAVPRASSRSTSISRWLRSGAASAAKAGAVAANVDGATSICPRWTLVRIAIISSREPFLGTNADAPAWAARLTHSEEVYAVTTATTASGTASRSFAVAVSPSSRGIWMSITTMSGCSRWASATPSAADWAIPMQVSPATESSAADSISAKERWSSTTSTVASGGLPLSMCALLRVLPPDCPRRARSPYVLLGWQRSSKSGSVTPLLTRLRVASPSVGSGSAPAGRPECRHQPAVDPTERDRSVDPGVKRKLSVVAHEKDCAFWHGDGPEVDAVDRRRVDIWFANGPAINLQDTVGHSDALAPSSDDALDLFSAGSRAGEGDDVTDVQAVARSEVIDNDDVPRADGGRHAARRHPHGIAEGEPTSDQASDQPRGQHHPPPLHHKLSRSRHCQDAGGDVLGPGRATPGDVTDGLKQ